MTDPFTGKEWLEYADRVINELVPKIQESAFTISLVPSGPSDVKFAVELGMSIMLDKPILAVVQPGTRVPSKLIAVADEIVEMGEPDDPKFTARMTEAINTLVRKLSDYSGTSLDHPSAEG